MNTDNTTVVSLGVCFVIVLVPLAIAMAYFFYRARKNNDRAASTLYLYLSALGMGLAAMFVIVMYAPKISDTKGALGATIIAWAWAWAVNIFTNNFMPSPKQEASRKRRNT